MSNNTVTSVKLVRCVEDLVGLTLTEVGRSPSDPDTLIFHLEDGRRFRLHHEQDCCESVSLEDITGDLQDLVGHPLLMSEESITENHGGFTSEEWTFYKFATSKGYVTLRWYSSTEGSYSMVVNFSEIKNA